MHVVDGITSHSIVVIVEKRDRGMALDDLLKKKGFSVVTVYNIYDAHKSVLQEMPHLVICDSILPDGTAGTLYDRLAQHPLLKTTPILVLVAKKTKEQLTPLTGRKFAGFLLGQFDGNTLMAKISEAMTASKKMSPYFIALEERNVKSDFMISVEAKVLGLSGEQVIYQSETQIDAAASLVCVPEDGRYGPVLLSMGTNMVQGADILNLFPVSRIRGKGRKWVVELPNIDVRDGGSNTSGGPELPPSKVMFFDPNNERFEQFKKVLSGYNIDLLQANSLQKAAQLLQRDAASFGCAYFHELPGSQLATVKDVLGKVPASERPTIIVGTSSMNMRSTAEIRYIQKPFGLGVLVEMMESAVKASSSSVEELGKSHQALNLMCTYQATAKLLGIDETGGIIQLKFPVNKGNRLKLEHPFLAKIWDGDLLAEITHTAPLPEMPDVWQARFVAVSSKGNKAKYWEKVEKMFTDTYGNGVQESPPASEENPDTAELDHGSDAGNALSA